MVDEVGAHLVLSSLLVALGRSLYDELADVDGVVDCKEHTDDLDSSILSPMASLPAVRRVEASTLESLATDLLASLEPVAVALKIR